MKYEINQCPVCKRKIRIRTYIARKVLKGQKIVDIWKHKDCKAYFELIIMLNRLEEIKVKLEKKIGLKKTMTESEEKTHNE